MLDKWEKLRNLIKADISHAVHYSSDKNFEHNVSLRYLKYMEELDARDKQSDGFYFTGIPDFDKKAWEKILENLEGLS